MKAGGGPHVAKQALLKLSPGSDPAEPIGGGVSWINIGRTRNVQAPTGAMKSASILHGCAEVGETQRARCSKNRLAQADSSRQMHSRSTRRGE